MNASIPKVILPVMRCVFFAEVVSWELLGRVEGVLFVLVRWMANRATRVYFANIMIILPNLFAYPNLA